MRFLHLPLLLALLFASVIPSHAVDSAEALRHVDDPMTFTFDTPVDTEGLTHQWTFGDGTGSTENTPSHTYPRPGRYLASVTVDDGRSSTTWTVVADAGVPVLFQNFETTPPTGWTYDPERLSTNQPIAGTTDWVASIVAPATTDSCVPPQHLPQSPPAEHLPQLGTDVYEALLDLRSAVLPDGAQAAIFWLDDLDSQAVVFETRVRAHQGNQQIGIIAGDDFGLHAQWIDLPQSFVRVEIHPWRATTVLPTAGGAHLRVLDPDTSEELATAELTGLANAHVPWEHPAFGISGSSFPVGSGGLLRLDHLMVRAFGCTPPTVELLGEWTFDEPENPGLDTSGEGRHAQLYGGAVLTDGALYLDGTGYALIPSLGAFLTDRKELSVEARVWTTDPAQMNVFRSRQPVALHPDRFGVTNYVEGNGWENVVATSVPAGRWYHLVGVFQEGFLRIYIDGALSAERVLPWSATDGTAYTDWAIGARVPGAGALADQFFTGYVDDVRLYTRALSPQEIESTALWCGR